MACLVPSPTQTTGRALSQDLSQDLAKAVNKQKTLESIGDKQGETVSRLETRLISLVVVYISLQSFIFHSVSHNPNMPCKFWWAPFSLSCLNCVIFAIPFKSFVTRWEHTKRYYEINFLEQDLVHLQTVIFSSDHDQQLEKPAEMLRGDTTKIYQRRAFISSVSLALVAYTIVVLTACRYIPCHKVAVL